MKLCMSKSWRRTNIYTIAVKYRYNDIQDYVEMLEEPKLLEDPWIRLFNEMFNSDNSLVVALLNCLLSTTLV